MTTSAEFFALVDSHVTLPMAEAGYAKIGSSDEWSNSSRPVPLQAVRPKWLASRRWFGRDRLSRLLSRGSRRPEEHVLAVGFEGYENGQGDEKWLHWYPDSKELDIRDWRDALAGHADWDVWHDLDVSRAGELERRLRVLGRAVRQS